MNKIFYLEKIKKTEWILADLLACRSLKEISQNCEICTYSDKPGLEKYYYKDYLILEVELVTENNSSRWVWRGPCL